MRLRLPLSDALMLREIIGPFVFGVALFSMLGMSITYLFTLTDYVVRGVAPLMVVEMSLMLLPGMMTKTLPAAMLLASLLATGRMSGDSEATALFAVGANLWRVIRAIAYMGLGVSILAIALTEYLVPPCAVRAHNLKFAILEQLEKNPLNFASFPIYDGRRIEYIVVSRDADFARRTFWGTNIIHYPKGSAKPDMYLYATEAVYRGGTSLSLSRVTMFLPKEDGPEQRYLEALEVPLSGPSLKLESLFRNLERQTIRDPDATNMKATLEKIADMKRVGAEGPEAIRNLEMGFYNKIAYPLATVIFALVGAPLGIRQSRTSNAVGFAIALVIIFGYWLLSSYMAVLGQGGAIKPILASFGANIVGLVFAVGLLIHRSR
ncbi:MAG: YjgP/YjgQ family permease [Fimbriimonadia bacterium]